MSSDERAALRAAVKVLGHMHMGVGVHPGARLDHLHPEQCDACARMVIEKMLSRPQGLTG